MATPTDTTERPALAYARETRDAAVKTASRTHFIAVVVGIFAVLSLIGMLIGVIEVVHFTNVITGPAPDCYSTGVLDPSC